MSTEPVGPVPVVKLPKQTKARVAYAKKIATCLDGNNKLNNPNPTLNAFNALIAALDKSEAATGGGKETTSQRNADELALVKAIHSECEYVRVVAHQQPTVSDAITVINSSGFFLRQAGTYKKPPLAAKPGLVTGDMRIVALAVKGATTYYWQWSLDQKNWSSLPETTKAKTQMSGLTAGTTYYFRFRALVIKTGLTDWSQVVFQMAR